MGNVARPGRKTLAVVALVFFILFPPVLSPQPTTPSVGETWEKSRTGSTCTLTVYADERYFLSPSGWVPINESIFPCPDGYCTNTYHYGVAAKPDGTIIATKSGETATFKLNAISGIPLENATLSASGSVLTYSYADGVRVNYQYLPRTLLEEVILESPKSGPLAISYSYSGTGFSILPATACDANGIYSDLETAKSADSISVTVPVDLLEKSAYPLVIDPLITIGDPRWNGYVGFTSPSTYTRTANPARDLFVGLRSGTVYKADIDWNVSVPNARILNVTLQLYVNQTGGAPLDVTNKDIANGSVYGSATPSLGWVNYSIDAAQLELLLATNTNFSVGLDSTTTARAARTTRSTTPTT